MRVLAQAPLTSTHSLFSPFSSSFPLSLAPSYLPHPHPTQDQLRNTLRKGMACMLRFRPPHILTHRRLLRMGIMPHTPSSTRTTDSMPRCVREGRLERGSERNVCCARCSRKMENAYFWRENTYFWLMLCQIRTAIRLSSVIRPKCSKETDKQAHSTTDRKAESVFVCVSYDGWR